MFVRFNFDLFHLLHHIITYVFLGGQIVFTEVLDRATFSNSYCVLVAGEKNKTLQGDSRVRVIPDYPVKLFKG